MPRATSPCTATTEARALSAHVPQLLRPCATTTEAHAPRAHALQQKKPPQGEACAQQQKSSPHSPQLEKACTQQRRPNAAKNK